jgi:hypothetical protein
LEELQVEIQYGPTLIHADNEAAIFLLENDAVNERSRHFIIDLAFARQTIRDKIVTLAKIAGTDNPADMMTKSLSASKITACASRVGLLVGGVSEQQAGLGRDAIDTKHGPQAEADSQCE